MGQDFESKVRYSLVGLCYNWDLLSRGDITEWNEWGHQRILSPTLAFPRLRAQNWMTWERTFRDLAESGEQTEMKQPFPLLNYVVAIDFHNTVVLQFSNSSYVGRVPYDQEQKLVMFPL